MGNSYKILRYILLRSMQLYSIWL